MSLPNNPSKAFIAANPHLYGGKAMAEKARAMSNNATAAEREKLREKGEKLFEAGMTKSEPFKQYVKELAKLEIVIAGQVRGGKNGMGVTRTGRHYAKPVFKAWRDDAVRQVRAQLPAGWTPIINTCLVKVAYVAGDKRRRDMPAVLDALWHVLEKAGFVTDDTLLWAVQSSRCYDKKQPRITVTVLEIIS